MAAHPRIDAHIHLWGNDVEKYPFGSVRYPGDPPEPGPGPDGGRAVGGEPGFGRPAQLEALLRLERHEACSARVILVLVGPKVVLVVRQQLELRRVKDRRAKVIVDHPAQPEPALRLRKGLRLR
eukprot:SAG22_NODE_3717_length_1561_cov_0.935021_1_plen_123_part_10